MFTGIVEELGEVLAVARTADAARLTIRGPIAASDAEAGDSIAVNGVCLTVVTVTDSAFTADVMAETLKRSTLGQLAAGARVNLERAAAVAGRLGGHIVQGHVDGTGAVLAHTSHPEWEVLRIALPARLAPFVVEKGSIGVDGVSLTVAGVTGLDEPGDGWFEVALIPSTRDHTTLGSVTVGVHMNLEVDIVAKYVARLVQARAV